MHRVYLPRGAAFCSPTSLRDVKDGGLVSREGLRLGQGAWGFGHGWPKYDFPGTLLEGDRTLMVARFVFRPTPNLTR